MARVISLFEAIPVPVPYNRTQFIIVEVPVPHYIFVEGPDCDPANDAWETLSRKVKHAEGRDPRSCKATMPPLTHSLCPRKFAAGRYPRRRLTFCPKKSAEGPNP